jgi:hypothetical protein
MEQLSGGRMLFRAVGVSFEGRQERIRKHRSGQELVLRKHSGNGYDVYAIGIFDPANRENPLGLLRATSRGMRCSTRSAKGRRCRHGCTVSIKAEADMGCVDLWLRLRTPQSPLLRPLVQAPAYLMLLLSLMTRFAKL